MQKTFVACLLVLTLIGFSSQAYAFGIYADVPVNFSQDDCDSDCLEDPSGFKAGFVMGNNIGLGVELYSLSTPSESAEVKYTLFDVSYLLPIPVVNLTLGAGFGNVQIQVPSIDYDETGNATQYWLSFGIPILPLFDLHVGYHVIDSSTHKDAISFEVNGKMLSVGAMFNF